MLFTSESGSSVISKEEVIIFFWGDLEAGGGRQIVLCCGGRFDTETVEKGWATRQEFKKQSWGGRRE